MTSDTDLVDRCEKRIGRGRCGGRLVATMHHENGRLILWCRACRHEGLAEQALARRALART